jgi:hypothetical protein
MTVNSLAKLLKDFGIKSKQYRSGDARYRGFDRCQFDDAFMRYLSTTPPSLLDTPLSARDTVTTVSDGAVSGFQPVTEKVNVTGKNDLKALQDGGCHGVTGQTGVSPEEGVITREL